MLFTLFHHMYYMIITKITEVNLSAFVYRLFHGDFFALIRTEYRCIITTGI